MTQCPHTNTQKVYTMSPQSNVLGTSNFATEMLFLLESGIQVFHIMWLWGRSIEVAGPYKTIQNSWLKLMPNPYGDHDFVPTGKKVLTLRVCIHTNVLTT